jgi:drug/metabolite transporter (DMT)-like permease
MSRTQGLFAVFVLANTQFSSTFRHNSKFRLSASYFSVQTKSVSVSNESDDMSRIKPFQVSPNSPIFHTPKEPVPKMSIRTAQLLLIAMAVLYGSSFGSVKLLQQALLPSVAAALRFSLAGIVFIPYFLKQEPIKISLLIGGAEVGLYNFIGFLAQAQALTTSDTSTVAFISSLAVIVVPILDLVSSKLKDKSIFLTFAPAVVASMGVACLEFGGSDVPSMGDLWSCLQPLFFGLGFWRAEKLIRTTEDPGDAQLFTGAMMMTVGGLAWIWALQDYVLPIISTGKNITVALAEQFHALQDWHIIAAILWTGIITTALTGFVENICLEKLSAAESAVIYSTVPIWGTAFAAVALHEQIGWNTFVGAFLVLSACVWSTQSTGKIVKT